MKLRNKKTREIMELSEDWEEYKGPEKYYYISGCANIESSTNDYGRNLPEEIWEKCIKRKKEVDNYFKTKEEAEEKVEKLKALKRLKDKGLKFNGWYGTNITSGYIYIELPPYGLNDEQNRKDMDLLFGEHV